MSEQQKIVPRKYGRPGDTEWEYGAHFRLTIDVPVRMTTLRKVEGNEYVSADEWPEQVTTQQTILCRARLSDLYDAIDKALENGHVFLVDRMDDGRSDPRGYSSLHKDEFTQLLQHVQARSAA